MKKLLAEWPQINWNLKLNQMHDTTRNRAQNKWSMSCAQLNFMGRPHGGKLGRPNHFLVARINLVYLKKKNSCFLIMNTKLHRNVLTCSDAPLHYVEFKYTRYSEAFIYRCRLTDIYHFKNGLTSDDDRLIYDLYNENVNSQCTYQERRSLYSWLTWLRWNLFWREIVIPPRWRHDVQVLSGLLLYLLAHKGTVHE